MAIPAHVRSFASVSNRRMEKLNGKDFDKKSHYIHVRPADQADILVLAVHGDNNDPDICDTARFIAMNPRYAAILAVTIEDVLRNDLNFNFDKVRKETLKRLAKKYEPVSDAQPVAEAG